jgi:hypothetical protein
VTVRVALADPPEWTVADEFAYVDVGSGGTVATVAFGTVHVARRAFDSCSTAPGSRR